MKIRNVSVHHFLAGSLAALSLFATAALAGPTLICHQFDIENARSLPWVSHNWNLSGSENYDTRKLASDTIAILDADSTVLVHMETLRRATLFARKDPRAAKELLTRLVARADSASASDTRALASFDAGYLAEAYKQWLGSGDGNPAKGMDGYALVKKAIQLRGNDPQMEFAAALIALEGPASEQTEHAQKALAGAKNDPLLARNLSSRFLGPQSQTLAELISRTKMARE
jgi:hypothetical protein